MHLEQSSTPELLRLNLAIEAAELGVFEYDIETDCPKWDNARMYELFGRDPAMGAIPPTEFLSDVVHPDDKAEMSAAFAQAIERSGPVTVRVRIRRQSDGQWRWVQYNAKAEAKQSGAPHRIVGVVADVTNEVEATDRLVDSELRYRTLCDTVPVGIVLVRRDGTFKDFNDAVCKALGYSRGEFSSLDVPTLDAGNTMQSVLARIDRVLNSNGVVRANLRMKAKDGTVHDILADGQRVDVEGVPHVRAIWMDVSAQQAATREVEQLLQRQALALEAASMGWWEWSVRESVAFWSNSLYSLLGMPIGAGLEPVDLFMSMVHPDDTDHVAASMRETLQGVRTTTDYRIVRPDGEVRWLVSRCSCSVDTTGQVVKVNGVVVDVTERKVLELDAIEAVRRKDEFLSMLAHELRNPLSPVMNSLAVLNRPNVPEDSKRLALDVINRQARHLARIVNDLLDAARISRGQIVLRREPVLLMKLLDDAIDVVKPLLDSRRQRLQLQVNAAAETLLVDSTRITQAIGNLLHNASKFSPTDSVIGLRVSDTSKELIIVVTDHGAGFTDEQRQRLFDLFAQGGGSPMHAEGGLGIGLAIVKRMTELHGGTVEAHSDGPGQGARFTMRLPRGVDEQSLSEGGMSDATVRREAHL